MRAYVMTTGVIFVVLVAAHLWRVVAETRSLAADPGFVLVTLACALLGLWAALLLRRPRPSGLGDR